MAFQTFNQSPYFDDYNPDDKFLKILFRPGIAVQTRELNQVQTILQKQVSRFGDHVFENGARVIGGGTEVDKDYFYVKLTSGLASSDDSTYVGEKIENTSTGLEAKIINVSRAEGSDPTTLYLKYTNSGSGGESTFSANDSLAIKLSGGDEAVTVEGGSSVGKGVAINLSEGIYYAYGWFHLVSDQTLIVSKYAQIDSTAEISIGLLLDDSVVTPEEDSSLRDNASGSTNFSAPGAHRYKVEPLLVNGSDYTTSENYIEILNLKYGDVAFTARSTDYSVLEETLARRTYDESGDYTVRDFGLSIQEHLDDGTNDGKYDSTSGGDETKLALTMAPGKAYVRGFEIETTTPTIVPTNKARTTDTVSDVLVPMQLGQYVYVSSEHNLPALFDEIGLYSDNPVSPGNEPSTKIGTAHVRNFVYDSATGLFRMYLFDINFSSGSIESVSSFYQSSTAHTSVVDSESQNTGGDTQFARTSERRALYTIPYGVIKEVTGGFHSYIQRFSNASISSGEVSLAVSSGTQFRDENVDYQVETESGVVDFPQSVSVNLSSGNTETTLDVSNIIGNGDAANGENVNILARVTRTTGQIRSKTPSQKSLTVTTGQGLSDITLDRPDVYEIVSVVDLSTENTDYTDRYELDTGQTATFYGLGSISLRTGESAPTEDLKITFKYYDHGAGDYFVAQSYTDNGIDYEDIPVFESSDGTQYPLANVIDFRPTINNSGTDFTSGHAYDPDNEIIVDFDYYLGRKDRVVLDKSGKFVAVEGNPSNNPKVPSKRDGAMTLYELSIPAYTFNTKDIGVKKIDNRRYTMRDIGEIQKRVENLEYYTLLSLLESDTLNRDFPEKFKSGFIVDNFETQAIGDSRNPNHKVSIDFDNTLARPEASTKSINLEYNSGLSSNIQKTGDLITLPYTEEVLIEQSLASRTEKINPFLKFGWYGSLKLTPSTDTWVATERRPDVTLDGGTVETVRYKEQKESLGTIWENWEVVWAGKDSTGETIESNNTETPNWDGDKLSGDTASYSNQTKLSLYEERTGVKKSAVTRTQTELVGEKVVSTSAVPYIRSRDVDFSGTGFKPNTKLYAFFDDVDVTDYCTPSPLKTDALGDISGTFSIPNNNVLKFKTGTRKFKLSDNPLGDNGNTFGKTLYTATGTLKELQREFVSTRVLDVETTTVSESRKRNFSVDNPVLVDGELVGREKTVENSGGDVGTNGHVYAFTVPWTGQSSKIKVDFSTSWYWDYYGLLWHWRWWYGRIEAKLVKIESGGSETVVSNTDYYNGYINFSYEIDEPSKAGNYELRISTDQGIWGDGMWWKYTLRYIEEVDYHGNSSIYTDPLAQSFALDLDGGAFITSLDVYLGPEANTSEYPVRCQIRNMVNGFPGNEVVPFSDVSVPAASLSGSNDASVATKFTFEAPIYLEQGNEYCFVLFSANEDLTAWVAKMGETSVSGNLISKQPYLGSVFKSQNNRTWEGEYDRDLKFTLRRAEFDTDVVGDVTFTNEVTINDIDKESDPYITFLDPVPFETTTGSNVVRVRHTNHSFRAGDNVTFDVEYQTPTNVNGIPDSELFDTELTVVDHPSDGDKIDPDYYYVQVSTNATADGYAGPDSVIATQYVGYSVGYFLVDDIQTNDVGIAWSFRGQNHASGTLDATGISVEPKKNITFKEQKVSKESGDENTRLTATLSTDSSNQTPVIDVGRCTLLATENRVNNKEDNDNVAQGYNAASRYILKRTEIVNPANQLRIFLDANRPSNTAIDVFYKVQYTGSDKKFENEVWKEASPDGTTPVTEGENFTEYAYSITESSDFNMLSIKVVLRSSDKARVPRFKNFRAIALKDVSEL